MRVKATTGPAPSLEHQLLTELLALRDFAISHSGRSRYAALCSKLQQLLQAG
jgi:hypothetical protein